MLGKIFGLSLMLISTAIFVAYTAFTLTLLPEVKKFVSENYFDLNQIPKGYTLLAFFLPGLALVLGLVFITHFIDSTNEAIRLKKEAEAKKKAAEGKKN